MLILGCFLARFVFCDPALQRPSRRRRCLLDVQPQELLDVRLRVSRAHDRVAARKRLRQVRRRTVSLTPKLPSNPWRTYRTGRTLNDRGDARTGAQGPGAYQRDIEGVAPCFGTSPTPGVTLRPIPYFDPTRVSTRPENLMDRTGDRSDHRPAREEHFLGLDRVNPLAQHL